VLKVRERLAVSKQATHTFHTEKFSLKKLKEVEGKEQYRVENSNRSAVLENLHAAVHINKAWETTIRVYIKISTRQNLCCYEMKKHKPWFEERCSKLFDQKKQAKL
jgi:hypothetical protein